MTPDIPENALCTAIEALPSIAGALAVDTSHPAASGCLFLFVVLRSGQTMETGLRAEIYRRAAASGNVPDAVYTVPVLPRTATGRPAVAAVRRLLTGEPVPRVAAEEQVANPDALGPFTFLFNNL